MVIFSPQSKPFSPFCRYIYHRSTINGTVEINIQGGINAAAVKGITPIFKVTSISIIPQSRNGREKSAADYTPEVKKADSFATVLEKETQKDAYASLNCHTTTYGSNCKMTNFFYQTKEYTF